VVLAPGVVVDSASIVISFVRSSGPGGQNVNKRSTKAQLRVAVDQIPLSQSARLRLNRLARNAINANGELVLSADETRSQSRNRKACMDRLKEIVMRSMIEPKSRKATRPTRGSVRRRLEEKKQRSQTKQRRRPPEQP
jgi:ribosome-associated protein